MRRRGEIRKKIERPDKTISQDSVNVARDLAASHISGPGGWAVGGARTKLRYTGRTGLG